MKTTRTAARKVRRVPAARAMSAQTNRASRRGGNSDLRALLRAPLSTQRSSANDGAQAQHASGPATDVSSTVNVGTSGGGASLSPSLRHYFEPRFGHDFGHVRMHTDTAAAASAEALNARAYTFGNDIVFGAGQYDPDSHNGRRLVAHELTHVLQQGSSPSAAQRVMRATYAGCDAATTGVSDANDRVDAAFSKARDMVQNAWMAVIRVDKTTLKLLDQHFHCPSVEQIETIKKTFEKINGKFLPINPQCVDATTSFCQQGKDSELGSKPSPFWPLSICPSAFANEDGLVVAFIEAAAQLSGLTQSCAGADPCYGDSKVSADTMLTNIDSYVGLVLEFAGYVVVTSGTVACGDTDKRLRDVRHAQTPPKDSDGCAYADCKGLTDGIRADLQHAMSNTDQAIAALAGKHSETTVRALNWYFNDHGKSTANTVRERLACIKTALQDTLDYDRYGCTSHDAIAFVKAAGGMCELQEARVCLDWSYFGMSSRSRAGTLIHECGHRVGLAVTGSGMDDVYWHEFRFLNLDTSESLRNADSYALFANAIVYGVPLTLLVNPGSTLSFGKTYPAEGESDTFFRGYAGIEAQHPNLMLFSPTLGVGFTALFHPSSEPGTREEPSAEFLASLLVGARIADPRPGRYGGPYLGIRAGPSLAFNNNKNPADDKFGIGAEAVLDAGWRWRWLDVAVTGGVMVDPFREEGSRSVLFGGASISFPIFNLSSPRN